MLCQQCGVHDALAMPVNIDGTIGTLCAACLREKIVTSTRDLQDRFPEHQQLFEGFDAEAWADYCLQFQALSAKLLQDDPGLLERSDEFFRRLREMGLRIPDGPGLEFGTPPDHH